VPTTRHFGWKPPPVPPHGEMREKGADFWGAHVRRVALMMEENKVLGPLHIRLFRSDTQVFEAYDMSHLIELFYF
jgi:hypothetical protein